MLQVKEDCEARAPYILPEGVEMGTFSWRVIRTLECTFHWSQQFTSRNLSY